MPSQLVLVISAGDSFSLSKATIKAILRPVSRPRAAARWNGRALSDAIRRSLGPRGAPADVVSPHQRGSPNSTPSGVPRRQQSACPCPSPETAVNNQPHPIAPCAGHHQRHTSDLSLPTSHGSSLPCRLRVPELRQAPAHNRHFQGARRGYTLRPGSSRERVPLSHRSNPAAQESRFVAILAVPRTSWSATHPPVTDFSRCPCPGCRSRRLVGTTWGQSHASAPGGSRHIARADRGRRSWRSQWVWAGVH